ncbi:DNA mismatch repair protein msh-2 [Diplocarpon rosae]|nr:DNA mismatch repair protein msh-2 [Diplocarpon rosae]
MSTATKKRKLSSAVSSSTRSRGLTAFTSVSKTTPISKSVLEKNNFDFIPEHENEYHTNRKKRKLIEEEHPQPVTETRPVKSLRTTRTPRTPQKPIPSQPSPALVDTPTKGARSLLDRFCITSKTPTKSPVSFNSSSSELIASTPEHDNLAPSTELPAEIIDLINLHAAFLTALSIHYAHNGTHSPADLRNLCPDVARAWGKRKVTFEDIRRTIGILNANIPETSADQRLSRLSLADYGHGKICIEIKTLGKSGRIARPINEDLLNETFERGLSIAWKERADESAVPDFIEKLPMEPIAKCSSLVKMSPLLAKGQRRLEDLRAGIKLHNSVKVKVDDTAGPKLTLLERLRAKQVHNAALPAPSSKAEVARRAALGRIDEVVAVLVILSTSTSIGQSRISLTLPTVIGKLRDSFKTPMSKEEADTCVRLLAAEIAPEWVKLVRMGKVEALVVNRDKRPTELDVMGRVRRAA